MAKYCSKAGKHAHLLDKMIEHLNKRSTDLLPPNMKLSLNSAHDKRLYLDILVNDHMKNPVNLPLTEDLLKLKDVLDSSIESSMQ